MNKLKIKADAVTDPCHKPFELRMSWHCRVKCVKHECCIPVPIWGPECPCDHKVRLLTENWAIALVCRFQRTLKTGHVRNQSVSLSTSIAWQPQLEVFWKHSFFHRNAGDEPSDGQTS
ncbi:hypothetical protein IF1G_02116 [Cordyceps javanica]|uniref:Uncharacterized protein n=1 Tax=Cordyceps javanica TaxID=43265 RepID=A0A545VDV1_9HYPO|nr:hypothetical protein IF1G_02116 [Cordyceps javanica]